MAEHVLQLILGFLEGFALIMSPCILVIVPVFLAFALGGSWKRPVGIAIGFCLSFSVLVLFSRQLIHFLNFDFERVRYIAYVILLLLALIMCSEFLSEKLTKILQQLVGSRFSSLFKNTQSTRIYEGIVLGLILALIWTPCAGPILASIIVQTVMQKTSQWSFFILIAFTLGVITPLLIISLYGKKLISSFNFFKRHAVLLRKILGLIIILNVIYLMFFGDNISSKQLSDTGIVTSKNLIGGLWSIYPAPDIGKHNRWLNSKPLLADNLNGKVILIDFWTYSCINCLRTIPYLNYWYSKYAKSGLIIVGIHTPEFDFEKKIDNVKQAVKKLGILYPIVLDNDYINWNNFSNHYWPAHYLVDRKGYVVYSHFGEGDYDIMENNIRYLLGIKELNTDFKTNSSSTNYFQSPETYLGSERAVNNASQLYKNTSHFYTYKPSLALHSWDLKGLWTINDHYISAQPHAALKIHFKSKKVYMVLGSETGKPGMIAIYLNGVKQKSLEITEHALYELVSLGSFGEGTLEIVVQHGNLNMYTLTFGS